MNSHIAFKTVIDNTRVSDSKEKCHEVFLIRPACLFSCFCCYRYISGIIIIIVLIPILKSWGKGPGRKRWCGRNLTELFLQMNHHLVIEDSRIVKRIHHVRTSNWKFCGKLFFWKFLSKCFLVKS